jgi:hypothetical protein
MSAPTDNSRNRDMPYGFPDPDSCRARFEAWTRVAGTWHDGMELVHLLALGQTVEYIKGKPLYTLHRLPLITPDDPATQRGLLVTALLDLNDQRYLLT